MSTFKQRKTKKKTEIDTHKTIDTRHRELLEELPDEESENQYLMDVAPVLHQYYSKDVKPIARKNKDTRSEEKEFGSPCSGDISDFIQETCKNDRGKLFDWYMTMSDPSFLTQSKLQPVSDDEAGLHCSTCNINKVRVDGMMVCPNCADCHFALLSADRPCFKEKQGQEAVTTYTYKRMNHLNEWLAAFQAKETTTIPPTVFQQIHAELKKCKWRDLSTLDAGELRSILKKLDLNKYYEHIPYILRKVTGRPAPVVSREKEDALRTRFEALQKPFQKHCPDHRNFLSYKFVLRKLFEMEGLPQSEQFTLPRAKKKIDEYNHIWSLLCKELGWPFILTVR
jgi:hypothetical protein